MIPPWRNQGCVVRVASTIFKTLTAPLLDFIYPPVCLTCDRMLENAGDKICKECRAEIRSLNKDTPVWKELHQKFTSGGVIDGFTSCYLFEKEGKLQQAIHSLKYQGMHSVGFLMGKDVGTQISADPLIAGADYVVPVPLHKLKERERGYNQAVHICSGIAASSGIQPLPTLLKRTRYTESQTKLDINQRKDNVSAAFKLDPKFENQIRGKSIILVDDIITTGSTISECGRILKEHGAMRVFAASVGLAE